MEPPVPAPVTAPAAVTIPALPAPLAAAPSTWKVPAPAPAAPRPTPAAAPVGPTSRGWIESGILVMALPVAMTAGLMLAPLLWMLGSRPRR